MAFGEYEVGPPATLIRLWADEDLQLGGKAKHLAPKNNGNYRRARQFRRDQMGPKARVWT